MWGEGLITLLAERIIVDIWDINCSKCDYGCRLNVGSTELDQTFTDLNEDFAYYRLFLCREEKKFISANIHDRHFDERCPADGSKLIAIDVPPRTCPECGAELAARKLDMSEILGE